MNFLVRVHSSLIEKLTTRTLIIVSGALLLLLSVPTVMRVVSESYTFSLQEMPHADAILVPGASVVHGEPSPVLSERTELALQLYRAGRANRILVSGDSEPNYDEVTPVKNYLLSQGVPSEVIFLDTRGLDTYSSMYRARWVFGARTLIIVSQDFHLPRAVFVARALGIDAYGARAEGGMFAAYLREIPASWKALFDLLLHRQPKYLGAPMPLAGTWREPFILALK